MSKPQHTQPSRASRAKPAEENAAAEPPAEAGAREGKPRRRVRDARALAKAVFARMDPIEVAVKLLSEEEKGDSVKARIWETLIEYRYGRPATAAESRNDGPTHVNLIFPVPRPERAKPADDHASALTAKTAGLAARGDAT